MLPQLGDTTEPSHGFYTQAQIRSVVEHAQSLGIEVVPEVDMPGHCKAVLTALPYLQDRNEANESYKTVQGFTNNALNPAMPATWEFVKTILDNIVALFPGRYIHIGGDEVADNSWIGSPLARELMEREGLEGTFELQSWFMRKLKIMLEQRGRVLAGWNEVAHGGGVQPEGTLLMAWQAPEIGIELAKQGYDVVMTPGQAYYLDMAQSHNWWEPALAGRALPRRKKATLTKLLAISRQNWRSISRVFRHVSGVNILPRTPISTTSPSRACWRWPKRHGHQHRKRIGCALLCRHAVIRYSDPHVLCGFSRAGQSLL